MNSKELVNIITSDCYFVENEYPVYILLLGEKVKVTEAYYSFENGEGSLVIVP